MRHPNLLYELTTAVIKCIGGVCILPAASIACIRQPKQKDDDEEEEELKG